MNKTDKSSIGRLAKCENCTLLLKTLKCLRDYLISNN